MGRLRSESRIDQGPSFYGVFYSLVRIDRETDQLWHRANHVERCRLPYARWEICALVCAQNKCNLRRRRARSGSKWRWSRIASTERVGLLASSGLSSRTNAVAQVGCRGWYLQHTLQGYLMPMAPLSIAVKPTINACSNAFTRTSRSASRTDLAAMAVATSAAQPIITLSRAA